MVDQDQDGFGEYGLLGELAGTKSRRGSWEYRKEGLTVANPSFLVSILGPKEQSFAGKSGYNFQVFIPGINKKPITDDGKPQALLPLNPSLVPQQTVINIQEIQFRAYAWPIKYKTTGIRCFAVDQAGEVLAAPNSDKDKRVIYEGKTQRPNVSAAVSADDNDCGETFEGNFRGGSIGKDGQQWTAAGN